MVQSEMKTYPYESVQITICMATYIATILLWYLVLYFPKGEAVRLSQGKSKKRKHLKHESD